MCRVLDDDFLLLTLIEPPTDVLLQFKVRIYRQERPTGKELCEVDGVAAARHPYPFQPCDDQISLGLHHTDFRRGQCLYIQSSLPYLEHLLPCSDAGYLAKMEHVFYLTVGPYPSK